MVLQLCIATTLVVVLYTIWFPYEQLHLGILSGSGVLKGAIVL
jgi:hypothetical protein